MVFSNTVSKRIRTRRRGETSLLRHVVWGGLTMCIVVGIGVALWYVTRLPYVTITHIEVEGADTVREDHVRAAMDMVLNGSYMLLVPHRFAYTYPHDALVTALQAEARIRAVEIVRTKKDTLRVVLEEYVPYALWCTEEVVQNTCYFLDSAGYAFAPAPLLAGGSLVRHIDEGNTELTEKVVYTSDDLRAVHAFVSRLERELTLRVTEVVYTKALDIKLRINGGGTILIARDTDFDATFEYLVSVLASDTFTHLEPGNFNYIDLRFGKKIFVNEETAQTATSTQLEIATTTN